METQTAGPQSNPEFSSGSSVIYALHGKCTVLGVEDKQVGGQSIRFYKLEIQKSSLSRSTRQEPAIWLPVSSASDRGLRAPMSREGAENALAVLASREYYFPLNEPWSVVHPKMEANIRAEGGVGLAKAVSYLHVLKKKQHVLSSEALRFQETLWKLMLRELSEALTETSRVLEERINKGLRQKTLADH